MPEKVLFDPLNKFYKSTIGPVREGKKIRFRVKSETDSVNFVWHKDGKNSFSIPMERKNGYFELFIYFDLGLYWYKFDLNNGLFIGRGKSLSAIITAEPSDYQLSVYSADYKVPSWTYGGIIYQIFPDRFYRSLTANVVYFDKIIHNDYSEDPVYAPDKNGNVLNNDFFGGNIKGITEKLDYISDLGVTIIYLNPIFKSFSNHRYDTGDFMQIDPLLGNDTDFKELVEKAREKGIYIVLDGVFNHVGDDSVYFNKYKNYASLGAYQSKNSPYYKWFKFIDFPDEYESWWGIKTLPAIDKSNEDYINFICGKNGVLERYLKLGVKGFRLDVVDELPKYFINRIRNCVKTNDKNAFVIGEVWEDASNKISYGKRREYFLGKELDSVMNYPLKNAVIEFVKNGDSETLSEIIKTQIDHYPKFVVDSLMNILSTHDTARLLSVVSRTFVAGKPKDLLAKIVIDDMEEAIFKVKAASLLQYTLCGLPSVYYGDEVGMQGLFDPLNRRFFPWKDINNDILNWYKLLGKIRRENSAFKKGVFKEVYKSPGFFAFKRKSIDNDLLIAVNVGKAKFDLKFKGKIKNLIDGKIYESVITVNKNFLGIFKKS